MSIKMRWAEYLWSTSEYKNILENEAHIQEWENFINENSKEIKDDIAILKGQMTIHKKELIIEFATINLSNVSFKELELKVTLSLFGNEYFNGVIKNNKDCYEELKPNEGRLDFINFVNDRFSDGEYSSEDYELIVHECNIIEYIQEEIKPV